MKLIRVGSKGPDVRAVQNFLIGEGHKILADGEFGAKTEVAVKAYQKGQGLTADGVIGNETLGSMLARGLSLMPTADNAPADVFPEGFPPRPNFTPLTSNSARASVFGRFAYRHSPTPSNRERIEITDGWETPNIVQFRCPQLASTGVSATGNVRFHRLVKDQFLGLWQAWEDAGLLGHIKSWEGAFVPRFVRGSVTTLSNHAFGSAFDINYTGNELGHRPAAVGTENSVRELVPLAHQFGFYWGGHFTRADGMHFEVAVVL